MKNIKEATIAVVEEILKKNIKPMIQIIATPVEYVELTRSKFGGLPYLPKNAQIPINSQNQQLSLLAQINCSELPTNDIYPKQGILQFWILYDCFYGVSHQSKEALIQQENFRVIYYPEIGEHWSEKELEKYYQPYTEEGKPLFTYPLYEEEYDIVEFELTFMPTVMHSITLKDGLFTPLFVETWNKKYPEQYIKHWADINDEEAVQYIEDLHEHRLYHQIGGYPYFVQEDPRYMEYYGTLYQKHHTLLLQIDSQFQGGIFELCWGDMGILNFFIEPDRLKNLDFSNVMYTMDCS